MPDQPDDFGLLPYAYQWPGAAELQDSQYEFAFGIVSDKLKAQLDRIEKVDTKLGAIVGAAAALIALWHPDVRAVASALVGIAFLVPIVLSGIGLATRTWSDPPNPASVVNSYRDYYAQTLHMAMLRIVRDYAANQKRLLKKAKMLNGAIAALAIATAYAAAVAFLTPGPR